MPVRPDSHPDAPSLKAALDSKRDLLERMPEPEIFRTHRLDAATAAGVVIGSLPRIAQHRDAIAAQFGREGAGFLDDLPIVARATLQANVELTASDAMSDLADMAADVAEEHKLVFTDAEALANRKLLDRSRVETGRPVQGYRTVATSTLVIVSLFREHWSAVRNKTPLTREDLDRVEKKAELLLQRLDEREQGSTRLPAAELRTRAISLLVSTYGEVRRMITYVRWWDEDADTIAPSLWSGRRRGSRNEVVVEPTDPTEPETPVTPIPTPGPMNGDGPFTS
ncbi:hypothetical protein [Sandaracinus amylolyticus]|uniref:Uncharacterized protein n=1 Tax=Sandaracinus amylolyticus TaxID=927083 RepID=A0A0F6SHI3_9BACT|nr:hypothetical protein [Sandaracinus amylolyticus]AKF10494.1 hypothetical protein DB32_007643 [Sandaracinus amylolyticus]